MRWRFEGRQRAARVGGKEHAERNGCDGYVYCSAMARGIDINTLTVTVWYCLYSTGIAVFL
jgi:hypothetical protein